MCSITIETASKALCLDDGRQTKGSTNRKFRLASLFQGMKSASGCIAKKSIVGPEMTKSVSGDEIKRLTEIKETISTEMAVVTTAQSKVVAITCLLINLYPIQKKRASFPSPSLPPFLFPSSPNSTKRKVERKVEIAFEGIEKSVLVFLFGVPSIVKPDKILKY